MQRTNATTGSTHQTFRNLKPPHCSWSTDCAHCNVVASFYAQVRGKYGIFGTASVAATEYRTSPYHISCGGRRLCVDRWMAMRCDRVKIDGPYCYTMVQCVVLCDVRCVARSLVMVDSFCHNGAGRRCALIECSREHGGNLVC